MTKYVSTLAAMILPNIVWLFQLPWFFSLGGVVIGCLLAGVIRRYIEAPKTGASGGNGQN